MNRRNIGEKPRVSVLMTIFNAAPFLRASLDSIVEQTFQEWELIVVENGSTDGSATILESYQDERIRKFFLESNIGRVPALRLTFDRANGEYIAVLDADDISHRTRLAKQVVYLDAHPEAVLLGTWANHINEHGTRTGDFKPATSAAGVIAGLATGNTIVHSSAMFRSGAARLVGGYPLDRPYAHDHSLWLKLMEHGEGAILPEILCDLRSSPTRVTSAPRNRLDVARDSLELLVAAGKQLKIDAQTMRRHREEVGIARVKYVRALAFTGHLAASAAQAVSAIIKDPLALIDNRVTRSLFSRSPNTH